MVNELFLCFAFVSIVVGVPLINPVNNPYASLRIADLFRISKTSNNFTIFDYGSSKEINVYMDYKDKIIKDLLFCPRTFDNPVMGYFGRNSNKQHVMCKEVLYQNIFTCITTNLRAECKSLKMFKNMKAKDAKLQTANFEITVETTATAPSTEILVVEPESNFSFMESNIFRFIILIIVIIFIILCVVVCCLLLKRRPREVKIIHFPNNDKQCLNNYCKNQGLHSDGGSGQQQYPRASV